MFFRNAVVVSLILLFGLPVRAAAQTPPEVWRDFAGRLAPGATVILRLNGGQRVKATLMQVTPGALVVLPKTRVPVPPQRIGYDAIRSLEPDERGLSTGKAVGLGVAAGVGAFLAMLMIVFASFND